MLKVGVLAFVLGTAVVLVGPQRALADAEDIETLRVECGKQLNLGTAGCSCIADTAAEKLNDNQQELVAAMVLNDRERAAVVQAKMTFQEQAESAEFMQTAPVDCATQ